VSTFYPSQEAKPLPETKAGQTLSEAASERVWLARLLSDFVARLLSDFFPLTLSPSFLSLQGGL